MKKKVFTLPRFICFVILLFIILHSTPQLSLRTYLFFTGYPKLAFTTQIESLERKIESNKNIKFYAFTPSPIDTATGNDMLAYTTTKIGFIYLSDHFGGG